MFKACDQGSLASSLSKSRHDDSTERWQFACAQHFYEDYVLQLLSLGGYQIPRKLHLASAAVSTQATLSSVAEPFGFLVWRSHHFATGGRWGAFEQNTGVVEEDDVTNHNGIPGVVRTFGSALRRVRFAISDRISGLWKRTMWCCAKCVWVSGLNDHAASFC